MNFHPTKIEWSPRLTPEDIIRRSEEAEHQRVKESLRAHLASEWEREERNRLWAGVGFAMLITGLAALAIYIIIHLR